MVNSLGIQKNRQGLKDVVRFKMHSPIRSDWGGYEGVEMGKIPKQKVTAYSSYNKKQINNEETRQSTHVGPCKIHNWGETVRFKILFPSI